MTINNVKLDYFDEKMFAWKVVKIHKSLKLLEKQKYLEPYYSNSFTAIKDYLLNQIGESCNQSIVSY